ncbi:MAG: glycosyltransferase, partial [Nitrospiraceae bacterium]|nr:glycosyltransferase [Nitrospiraceae bacterium]
MRELGPDSLFSVVAPVHNECGLIDEFITEVGEALIGLNLPGQAELVLVDDGSTDGTGAKLDAWAKRDDVDVRVVHLARNFGQSAAVSAGLDRADGDVVVVIDADLQDDPAAFGPLLQQWRAGHDVVYAVRSGRDASYFVRFFSWLFYRMIRVLGQIELPLDAGNYALMDRRVVASIRQLPERNRYIPGLRTWVGFKQTGVPVRRRKRRQGESRVGIRGLWTLAMNAVFSFSYVPLFVFRVVGALTLAFSVVLTLWALGRQLLTGETVASSTSYLAAISFFGGINLLGISVVGEYVA